MGRCREVPPEQDRLYLADVYKRAHEEVVAAHDVLVATGTATTDQIQASQDRVDEASARTAAAVEDNDWIDVKHRLNVGEASKSFSRAVKSMNSGEKTAIDPELINKSKIISYLLGWSLMGLGGKPIPYDIDMPESVRVKALDKLDVETFMEIYSSIQTHEADVEKESVARKKMKVGERASSKTPSSPSGSEDGHSMMSAV